MSTETEVVEQTRSVNHISTVRTHLLDQMAALRKAHNPEEVKREIDRSKGLAELAQAVVNTAKVEVDYLKATNQSSTPFLEVPPDKPYLTDASGAPALPNGITGITRHRIKG
ncbi:MAG: hypothetical protein AB7I35_12075 [Ramlibacter sp.]